jgi:prolyl 4-hydroxylase
VEEPLSAEAVHLMALHAGEGVGVPQDWGTALDLLLRSAELGWPLAQASLAGLAGDWALARGLAQGNGSPPSDWKRLRSAIDLGAWFTVPKFGIVSASPRIAVIENFASPEICDWLIERARTRLGPAKVFDLLTGAPTHEAVRDNSECHFATDDGDLILQFLRSRIAAVTELFVTGMEAPAVLHYTVGQRFLPHYDFLDETHPGHAKDMAQGGQRVLTFLLSLNDDYEGGETQFPILGKRYRGRKGNALFFWNVEPDGSPDKRVLHSGLPPTRGEKWILSQWIRGRL